MTFERTGSRGVDLRGRVMVSNESLLLFFAMTIPLTVIKFVGWWLWEDRHSKNASFNKIPAGTLTV